MVACIVIPPFCGHRSGKGRSDVRVLDIAPEGSNRYLAPVLRNILTRLVPTRDASGVIYGTLVTAGAIVTASEAAERLSELDIAAIGANHGAGLLAALAALEQMGKNGKPLATLPNVGLASLSGGRVIYPHATPEYFGEFARNS